jgi:hypothetical protein
MPLSQPEHCHTEQMINSPVRKNSVLLITALAAPHRRGFLSRTCRDLTTTLIRDAHIDSTGGVETSEGPRVPPVIDLVGLFAVAIRVQSTPSFELRTRIAADFRMFRRPPTRV